MVFTIVLCAIEKGGRFVPKGAASIAETRKKEIEGDAKRSHPFWLPLE